MKKIPSLSILKSLPFLADTSKFIRDNPQLGDFYKLNFILDTVYVVTSPELLHHITVNNESNYPKSKVYWGELRRIIGNALGTLGGDDWLWMKKLQMPFFTKEMSKSYLPAIVESNVKYFAHFGNQGGGNDLTHDLAITNLAAIIRVIFGGNAKGKEDEIAKFIASGENIIAYRSAFPWRPFLSKFNGMQTKVNRYLSFFNDITRNIFNKRKDTAADVKCMMDELIKNSIYFNGKLTMEDIRNEIIVHLGASTETVAVAMTWTLYFLEKHPHEKEKVMKELSIFHDETLSYDSMQKLPVLTRALKEALRLNAPSHALTRDALENDEIRGHTIKKGAIMYVSTFGIHRNPDVWDEPKRFNPDRFLTEGEFPKYSFVPFGSGKHTCIGRYLAMPQMVLSLAYLLKNYNLTIHNKNIDILSDSTLKPDQNIHYSLTPKTKGYDSLACNAAVNLN